MKKAWLLFGACVLAPQLAWAIQPLEVFVRGAREHNPDNAEALAGLEQQQAQAAAALGRALPNAAVRGSYTRNEYNVVVVFPLHGLTAPPDTFVLTPFNQLDAFFTVNVPLVDVTSFERIAAAHTGADAARFQLRATNLQVEAQVVQNYYQLVANQALVSASQRALDVSKANAQLTQARFEAGKAAVLEVDRANAEVERQQQQLTAAQLQVSLSARALESSSGVTPELSNEVPLNDDLHEEPPLENFQKEVHNLPAVAASLASRLSAEQQATAQKLSLVPALSGNATEHLTNAAGFVGHAASYQAVLALNWQLDYTTFANIRAQDAAAEAARAREQRATLLARDAIHRTWATVGSAIARSRSARAEQKASAHASTLAQDRYEAGAATQLDLLQAQRDAFAAEVSRIQADAELANARLQLRLATGIDPFEVKGTP